MTQTASERQVAMKCCIPSLPSPYVLAACPLVLRVR
jgi:hypothetical protein